MQYHRERKDKNFPRAPTGNSRGQKPIFTARVRVLFIFNSGGVIVLQLLQTGCNLPKEKDETKNIEGNLMIRAANNGSNRSAKLVEACVSQWWDSQGSKKCAFV